MTLRHLKIFSFSLNLSPFFGEKQGIVLFAEENGRTAWSEISPLIGRSKESLRSALKQVFSLKHSLVNCSIGNLQKEIEIRSLHPSVAFGLESLLASLHPPLFLPSTFPVCGFLSGTYSQINAKISSVLREFTHVKLKVSQLKSEEAHDLIEKLKSKVHLCIDVNRAWTLEESLSFFNRYPLDTFSYIEEPVKDLSTLARFPFPTALDETLCEIDDIPPLPQIKAIIIKPMVIGKLSTIQSWILFAKKRNISVIFSTAFESGIGIFHLCRLWQALSLKTMLGIAPYCLIQKDTLISPHIIHQGQIKLKPLSIDVSQLKEISYV